MKVQQIILIVLTLYDQNDQINKENLPRIYNYNDKNKNIGTPEISINQYPENQTIYPCKCFVPGTNRLQMLMNYYQT